MPRNARPQPRAPRQHIDAPTAKLRAPRQHIDAPTAKLREIVVHAGNVARTLSPHGKTLVTTRISNRLRRQTVAILSDEFCVRLADGKRVTAHDYAAQVKIHTRDRTEIRYVPRPDRTLPPAAPTAVVVTFTVVQPTAPGDPGGLRKQLHCTFPTGAPDPLLVEVERLRTTVPATRGGRGEPVVLAGHLILLPENPSQQTRHTDGNQPAPNTHRYERVGNHSVVELDNGDTEPHPEPGLVRCLHFPLLKRSPGTAPTVASQTVLLLAAAPGATAETTVLDHIQPPAAARAFTHYNNWFDPDSKNLRGDTLPRVLARFQSALAGTGIRLDALVPDNGWQDRRSVWRPDPGQFPNGNPDLARLGKQLAAAGSGLGLWLAIDNTTNDVGFAEARGFTRAKPNAYFRQYFPHQSLADPGWQNAVRRQLETVVETADLRYAKLDFNHLSHTVPTDRHGHEAELDGFIHITEPLRAGGVFVNATNWTWHAPAWRKLADTVWMLAGDDGFNSNFPELSGRAQATTDRDTFFWRMWGDPADRPWFPISAIMTHGIIRNAAGQMSFPTDTALDWSDHVLMHYGRGTLLREWYLSPSHVTPGEWQALIAVHQWADSRRADLIQTTFAGGRPDEGDAYGYVGWAIDGKSGTLVARNPSPAPQVLEIPLDHRTNFRSRSTESWTGTVVYPRTEPLDHAASPGQTLRIPLAGYETVAVHLRPGKPVRSSPRTRSGESAPIRIANPAPGEATITFGPETDRRRTLMVIGYPVLPDVRVDGKPATALRTASGTPNTFASYAIDGMPSAKARRWSMAEFDLAPLENVPVHISLHPTDSETIAEAWAVAEQTYGTTPKPPELPSPRTFPGFVRQTRVAIPPRRFPAAPASAPVASDNQLRNAIRAEIQVSVFGNSGGYGEKTVLLSGKPIGVLPRAGDSWTVATFPLAIVPGTGASRSVEIEIACPADDDKFKVGRATYRVIVSGGPVLEARSSAVFCHDREWAFFEGSELRIGPIPNQRRTPPIRLSFERPPG